MAGLLALLALPTVATNFSVASSSSNAAAGGSAPEIGSLVDHKFSSPPMNSNGLTNLADLRGRPVLIEYWGTH